MISHGSAWKDTHIPHWVICPKTGGVKSVGKPEILYRVGVESGSRVRPALLVPRVRPMLAPSPRRCLLLCGAMWFKAGSVHYDAQGS